MFRVSDELSTNCSLPLVRLRNLHLVYECSSPGQRIGDLWIRMPMYASGSVVMKHRMESHHVSWARNVELSGPVPGVDTSHESIPTLLAG